MSNYQLNGLNNDIQTSLGSSYHDFLGCIGASYSGSVIANRKFTMDIHLDYAFYHSTPVVIELNDSSRHYLRGFHLGMDGCKDLFPRKENIDMLFGLGFNTGRLLFGNWDLTVDDKTNRRNRYSNPFFAPKLSFEQRFFVFKHLSISIRTELQYDITNKSWKKKSNSLQPISEVGATGYNLRLTLGWRY